MVKKVSEVAVETRRAPGTPECSDVCFSPRARRPREEDDPHETMRDAAAFHATRFDWVYSTDPEWIAECKRRGYHFTGALNTILSDLPPGSGSRIDGRILDREGNRVAAPWMRNWPHPGYWGCVNSPAYRETFMAHARLLIDGGVDAVQMDDPDINAGAVAWGGCFCEHCRHKAEEAGLNLDEPAEMRALQEASARAFYCWVRGEIDRYAKRHVPWSSNNYDGRGGFPYDLFDFGIAELPHESATPAGIHGKFRAAARSGRQQIFTLKSDDVPFTRRVIATAYASGGHLIVPYDVYFDARPRIFMRPGDCADLYAFVRANAALLDSYEDAAVSGFGMADERWPGGCPAWTGEPETFVAVRARPGEASKPVVIHLVDWRDEPEPLVLRLRGDAFFDGHSVKVTVQQPPPYDRGRHEQAARSGDYAELTRAQVVTPSMDKGVVEVRVPALSPWAMVVVEPAGS